MSYPGSEGALLSQGATYIGLALPLLSHRVYQVVQLVIGHVDNMLFLGLLGRPMYLLLFFIKPVGFRRSFIGASTCKFTNYPFLQFENFRAGKLFVNLRDPESSGDALRREPTVLTSAQIVQQQELLRVGQRNVSRRSPSRAQICHPTHP